MRGVVGLNEGFYCMWKRRTAFEMNCYKRLLHITHSPNVEIHKRVAGTLGRGGTDRGGW